jgi:D-alanyl-D-alanine carboxypeptidase
MALLALPGMGRAQIGSQRYASIVTEAETGQVLTAANPDELRHPASLTKMMTLYVAFEALREGRLRLDTPIPVSDHAAAMPPSRIGLLPGMTISAEEAILALVTKSANDAAAALGEYLGQGSEDRFAQMITLKARSLGMTRTVFRNASGLPDAEQVSTARDMALLGRRLMKDFPDRFAYFSTSQFRFRGRIAFNHNRLLQEYEGTDGIKTGYVNDSGFNLVASARRDGVRLVAAVFGGRTGYERDRHMMALLDQGFLELGVAPRQAGAGRRPAPQLVAAAQAAAPAGVARAAPRPPTQALPLPPARQTAALRPASTKSQRPGQRMEQGDTDRGSLRAPPRPPARPAVLRAAVAKPSKPGKQQHRG